jgi:hypothetical protein
VSVPAPDNPLDDAIVQAWQAMKSQRWAEAVEALNLPPAPERPGAMARVHAFRAQALFELGKWVEAEQDAAAAVRWAKKETGQAGLAPLRALQARILTSHAAFKAAEIQRQADNALAGQPDTAIPEGAEGAAIRIRKANVLLDRGDLAGAERTALVVWSEASSPLRERIFAALTLARCGDAAERWITLAHAAADEADDQNLLAAVARAARMSGVTLKLISHVANRDGVG